MDCLVMVFMDEFSNCSIFSVVLLVPGGPECSHLQLTLDRPWNVNVTQKLLSAYRMLSKSLVKHLKGFSSEFTGFHTKLDTDTLLDFAIHHRQNETQSQKTRVKTMRVHSMVSHGRLMQCAFRSVTFASPLIFFQGGSYSNNSLWNIPIPPCTIFSKCAS
jgi:hypothetical protein